MGLFAPDCPSAAATAVNAPAGVDSGVIVKELKSRFGAIIANGQGEMKGKIFRIAHLGFFDYLDTIALIGALEQVVAKSFPSSGFAFGNGLIAAQKVFAERSATAAADASCLCGRTDACCSLKHAEAGAALVGAK
jgi:aspartate aminotransferase-like enzyme